MLSKKRRWAWGVWAWALVAVALDCRSASLEWKTKRIETSAVTGDAPIEVAFEFVNRGPTPVTIESVETSCSCTTVEVSQKTYAPGEPGKVRVTFEVGPRVGKQEKIVEVVTDDVSAAKTSLGLVVNIAELLRATHRFVMWRIGDPNERKSVDISCLAGKTITHIEAAGEDSAVSVRVETLAPGTAYRVWLQPTSTEKMTALPVKCTAYFGDRKPAQLTVYALVK